MLQENGQMCKIQKCRRCSKAEDVLEQEGAKAFQMRGEAGAEPLLFVSTPRYKMHPRKVLGTVPRTPELSL